MPLPTLTLCALLLTPAQAGKLELTNIRATYGLFGPTRPDFKILAGDVLQVVFDIGGLTPDDAGRLRFAAKMAVIKITDGKEDAKPVYEEDLGELPAVVNVLGGGKVPHGVVVTTGLKQAPGQYRLKVTITDVNGKKEGAFTRDFTVKEPEFALVRFQLSYDRYGQLPAPAVGVVGQTLYVNAVAVGYKPDPKDQQASLTFEMQVLDDGDKPVLAKPLTGEVKGMAVDTHVPFRFELPVHRTGRYKIVLKTTDQVAKKTATLTVPLLAAEQR
jgi:hypothetical protein